jgi:hypothetical protein
MMIMTIKISRKSISKDENGMGFDLLFKVAVPNLWYAYPWGYARDL